MSNLGDYQKITSLAKNVGGPKVLGAIVFVGGYVVTRTAEVGVKRVAPVVKARVARVAKRRSGPCETKGQVFPATSSGEEGDARIAVGDDYRVLECDGDVVLIEILGDSGNPYYVSGGFLRSVSAFP